VSDNLPDVAETIKGLQRLTNPATDEDSVSTEDAVRFIDSAVALLKSLSARVTQVETTGYAKAIEDLRWLTAQRGTYGGDGGVAKLHGTQFSLITQPQMTQWLYCEYTAGRHLADILAGINDGMGWLPSSKWDEWQGRKPASVPGNAEGES
jgi:hypothetical protein